MSDVNTALHEAGHAVAALELGFEVEFVSIEPEPFGGGTRAGGVSIRRREGRHYSLSDELTLAFAGMAVAGPEGGGLDMYGARVHYGDRRLHLAHLGDAERRRRYDEAYHRARRILADQHAAVDELAVRLLQRKRLTGAEVRQIITDVQRRVGT